MNRPLRQETVRQFILGFSGDSSKVPFALWLVSSRRSKRKTLAARVRYGTSSLVSERLRA